MINVFPAYFRSLLTHSRCSAITRPPSQHSHFHDFMFSMTHDMTSITYSIRSTFFHSGLYLILFATSDTLIYFLFDSAELVRTLCTFERKFRCGFFFQGGLFSEVGGESCDFVGHGGSYGLSRNAKEESDKIDLLNAMHRQFIHGPLMMLSQKHSDTKV